MPNDKIQPDELNNVVPDVSDVGFRFIMTPAVDH